MSQLDFNNTVEERVTGRLDSIVDMNNAVISESDIILHNTRCCQSKFYKMTRFLNRYAQHMSVGEIATAILMDKYD